MCYALDVPCNHNSWENVRIRRKISTLRCRVCQKQVKLSCDALKKAKCIAFTSGHCGHAGCTLLHIHASKQSLVERVEIHGKALLDGVPELDRPKEMMAAAACPPSPSTASVASSETLESTRRVPSVQSAASSIKTVHFVHDDGSIEEYEYECAVEPVALCNEFDFGQAGASVSVSPLWCDDDLAFVRMAPLYTPCASPKRSPTAPNETLPMLC